MSRLEEFEARLNKINSSTNTTIKNLEKLEAEDRRVANIAHNSRTILDNLDEQFEKQTGLSKLDASFLFVAVALQVARQYLLTKFPERLSDGEAAKQVHTEIGKFDDILKKVGGEKYEGSDLHKVLSSKKEHSNRHHRYYSPSVDEIVSNPVPFDANVGAAGALSGGGRLGHRATALGHDPILGLIVGTSNIATSTITNKNLQSFHIHTHGELHKDFFSHKAQTPLVFWHTGKKLFQEGMDGKKVVAISLIKEIIHLKTDLRTKHSLPFPMISTHDTGIANELAAYGIDMANIVNVGKQAVLSALINSLIAMIHGAFYINETGLDKKVLQVRTRKILMYSNIIASTSNLVVVGITKNLKLLDVGGLIITIHRIANDQAFIRKVKEEFIFGNFKKLIQGEDLQLEECDL